MNESNSTGNTVPDHLVKKRLRDYGAFQVDISQLATRKIPVIESGYDKDTPPTSIAISFINNDNAKYQATSVMPREGRGFYPGPPHGKFGNFIKIEPSPIAALLAQVNHQQVDIQQPSVVTTKKPAWKKQLSFAIRLVLTLLMFSILLKSMSWSALLGQLTHMSWGLILVALVVGASGVVVSSYQWRSLLLGEKIRVDLAGLINLYMVGIGFSHFLPTGMGGDAVKALFVGRESSNSAGSISAVVLCRVTGFIGMLLIASAALIIWRGMYATTIITSFSLLSLLVSTMIGGAVISVSFLPRLFKGKWENVRIFASVLQVGNALNAAGKRPRSLLRAILYGIAFQFVAILNCYAYANALGIQVSLRFLCVAVPLIALVAFLPVSINGYGLRESTYVYIFSTIHVHVAAALLLALMQDAQTLLFGIIGGCIYFQLSGKPKSKPEQELKSRPGVQSTRDRPSRPRFPAMAKT